MTPPATPSIELVNGTAMPMVGYGTYRTSSAKTEYAVREALEIGYRSIDTAQCYGNEDGVGRALAASELPREEVFLTTKTWTNGYSDTKRSIDRSLSDLRTDYVDLLLVHEPTGDIPGIYAALEEALQEGKARGIGVSNFIGDVLDDLLKSARVKPMVNQVETHPYRQQVELQKRCFNDGIIMESWSPLVAGSRSLLRDEVIGRIAQVHEKSPAQVVLRWLVQRGIPVIPKTLNAEHMRANLAIFDFALTKGEMAEVARLDTGQSQFGWW
ncbi:MULTISPECIES: aldo/keto reductase [unclassified Adlercreutzia]|uniref:aldo/keto reductase n=1 Tax=unclassified Adlercreutzia TaxID=2636013 RepID=UPI0013ECA3AD|nr:MULTISPECIES: aldo/keto reductase [unclassified Adlercreutzia]